MKKYLIILFVAIILIITFILIIKYQRPVNSFYFPNTLTVENNTHYDDIDILSMIILNKIFLYDTMNIKIYYFGINMDSEKIEIVGFIQKNPFEKHSYNIFVKKDMNVNIKKFLSHELIHLKQMENGDLVQSEYYNIYKKDTIYFNKIKYEDRKYEMESFSEENIVYEKLNNLLYN